MVAKKRKSKRQTLQKKYKIVKRVQQHNKRMKKGSLTVGGKKKTVENRIPNAWPFKEELLNEIAIAKAKAEEAKLKQKDKRHEEIMKRRTIGSSSASSMDVEGSRAALLLKGGASNDSDDTKWNGDHDDVNDDGQVAKPDIQSLGQNSRRAYLSELRKVVEGADVILHVLDARDPLGTKSVAIEEMVLSHPDKRLVFVLNKADLVPRDVLSGWLTYLRRSTPSIPFKCNTQTQKDNLGRARGKVTNQEEGALKTNQAVGAEELLGLLKNYSRIGDSKSIIVVGIVGFPNVGKSSLINSLMRSRAAAVSSVPGFTKVNQEVILDKNIRLIDSPGIVFADGDSSATALRNCVNVEEMVDVLTPIQAILDRCPQAYLMQLYAIPKFKSSDCLGFLALVAKITGKLKKGGIPNTDAAARTVIHDWNTGKIQYYCRPPAVEKGGGLGESDSKLLSSFSKELDINALRDEDMRVLDAIEALGSTTGGSSSGGHIAMDTYGDQVDIIDEEQISLPMTSSMGNKKRKGGMVLSSSSSSAVEDDDNMMEEETIASTSRAAKTSSKISKNPKSKKLTDSNPDVAELPTADVRKVLKKQKKKDSKLQRRSGDGNESYSFDEDFAYDN